MATWTSLGHAMRRRMGAPSNHHEAAGKSMSRNNMTPEEVLASAEHANSARKYVGQVTGVANMSGAPSKGTLMPKKNTQAADPTAGGKSGGRPAILNAGGERLGAAYRVKSKYSVSSPEAAATQANGRTVPSTMGSRQNFSDGTDSSKY